VRSILLTFLMTVSTATFVNSDITDEVVYWMEEAKAQGECSSYIGFLYEDYTIGGFKGKSDALRAKELHLDKAIFAAQKFVELTSENDVDGKRMIFKRSGKICINETCFPSSDYIAAMFTMGGIQTGSKEVSEKEIVCPDGVWLPCYGAEPVENRKFKASRLYNNKNCRVLLR
jgi:hypothetical protein